MVRRTDKSLKTGSGTPEATIHRQLRHTSQLRLESLLIEIQRTAAHPAADAIHDLRVAIRRGTEVLHVMQIAAIPNVRARRRLIKRLRRVRRAGGAVRDCDVLLQMMPHWPTDSGAGAVVERQMQDLNLTRISALNTLTHRLGARTLAPAIRQSIALLQRGPGPALDDALMERMNRNQRRFAAMVRKAKQDPTDRRLHRARIAAKHWRYALEMCPTGMKRQADKCERRRRQLKASQELLGNIHDLEMLAARFEGSAADKASGRPATKHSAWLQQTRRKRKALISTFFQTPLVRTMLRDRTKINSNCTAQKC